MPTPVHMFPGDPPQIPDVLWRRTIPARLSLKDGLMEEIEAEMSGHGLIIDEDRHWLLLCLDEALVNAILHGNEADDAFPVDITLGLASGRWVIRIDDQGHGFTLDSIPDQEEDDSLFLEHGRGIRLMREWLDELHYWRGGATLWMSRGIP